MKVTQKQLLGMFLTLSDSVAITDALREFRLDQASRIDLVKAILEQQNDEPQEVKEV